MNKVRTIVIAVLFYTLAAPGALAAPNVSFAFTGPTTAVRTNSSLVVTLELNSADDAINAVGGDISFPGELLSFIAINDAGSVVAFWVDRPSVAGSVIHFSGIIPGGYYGEHGRVFKIIFETKRAGHGMVSLSQATALKNDGTGSSAEVGLATFNVAAADDGQIQEVTEQDKTPPESFLVEVTHDPSLLNDQRVAVFSTQDKDSGFDHFEVQENTEPFVRSDSPYVIKNFDLQQLTVRAYDRAGNARDAQWVRPVAEGPLVRVFGGGILKEILYGILIIGSFLAIVIIIRKFLRGR